MNTMYERFFWQSIDNSIYLHIYEPLWDRLVSYYRFADGRLDTDITREELDALKTAMEAASAAFVRRRTPESLMSEIDHDLRAALGRSSRYADSLYLMNTHQVARALHEEVKEGRLVLLPERRELRECVAEILADGKKRSQAVGGVDKPAPVSPAEVLYGNTPRNTPVRVSEFMANEAGDEANALVGKSPSLQADLKKLDGADWKIRYGEPGGGSYANRERQVITLDSSLKGHPEALTQTLSHEVGHATYPYQEDFSSKAAYLRGTMADEGAATMTNIRTQREILAHGGTDIGVAGRSHASYNAAYDQFLKDGNAAACRDAIGVAFGNEITSSTGQTYNEYYGGWYDKTFSSGK
ncbi:hypothetical protein AAHK20_07210 [Trinickia sp. YCB016]